MPRRRPRGFALLIVLMLASAVAILVYLELPRAVMENQREKEALLVDRGEQYKRAIELHIRKTNRLPQGIEDLEQKSPGTRFLRHRFVDPMTHSSDWRLVHIGPGGIFVDSAVAARNSPMGAASGPASAMTPQSVDGSTGGPELQPSEELPAFVLRVRGSDRIVPNDYFASAAGAEAAPEEERQADEGGEGQARARVRFPAFSQSAEPAFQDAFADETRFTGQTGEEQGRPSLDPRLSAAQADAFAAQDASGEAAQQLRQAQIGAYVARLGSFGSGVAGVATRLNQRSVGLYRKRANYAQWEFIFDPPLQMNFLRRNPAGANDGSVGAPGMSNGKPGDPFGQIGLQPNPSRRP